MSRRASKIKALRLFPSFYCITIAFFILLLCDKLRCAGFLLVLWTFLIYLLRFWQLFWLHIWAVSLAGSAAIGPSAEDDIAGAVNRTVDDFLFTGGSIHHIAVPGVDCHMPDVQVTLVYPERVKD